MSRIRTVKPEMWWSEDLASVSVTAMVTFIGLLTQADDSGRFLAHPAIIAGRLWALRAEHTPAHVANDLEQLEGAGLICRYTGCDGKNYLHIVTWEKHQRIDRPSASRMPRCPAHQAQRKCSECGDAACTTPSTPATTSVPATAAGLADAASQHSTNTRRVLDQTVSPDFDAPADSRSRLAASLTAPGPASEAPDEALSGRPGKTAGQAAFDEGSTQMCEGSSSGSRILDPGSVPTGREAPAPGHVSEKVSAKDLVAEYAAGYKRRPPSDTLGLLGRKIKVLLDEDFTPRDIRAAMELLRDKHLHPSVLPSLVNQVVNASPQRVGSPSSSASGAGPWASAGSTYVPYRNPAPAPTTFGGSL